MRDLRHANQVSQPRHIFILLLAWSCWLCALGCESRKQTEPVVQQDSYTSDDGDWKYIGSYQDREHETKNYLYSNLGDLVKIAPEGTVRIWIKVVPVAIHEVEGPPAPQAWSHTLYRLEAACAKGESRTLAIRNYNWQGEVFEEYEQASDWSAVAPGTVGDMEYSAACGTPQKAANDAWTFLKGLGEFLERQSKK